MVIKAMHTNAKSRVWTNGCSSQNFEVKVGVSQGSVLSPLLVIMVLEALLLDFRKGCP